MIWVNFKRNMLLTMSICCVLLQTVTDEEEMGLAGAAAEDAESEYIRKITETSIVSGETQMYLIYVVHLQCNVFHLDCIKSYVHLHTFATFTIE